MRLARAPRGIGARTPATERIPRTEPLQRDFAYSFFRDVEVAQVGGQPAGEGVDELPPADRAGWNRRPRSAAPAGREVWRLSPRTPVRAGPGEPLRTRPHPSVGGPAGSRRRFVG